MTIRIGIDLGGTKTEIVALDEKGNILIRKRHPTPSESYESIIKLISRMVTQVEKELKEKATVGIGMPGAISPVSGLIKNANTQCLIGHPLDQDLEKVLKRPIKLTNDANCFALSEAVDGAAARAEIVFGVILGTGTGGGIVVNQKVLTGINAIAGEWGHNPLPWPNANERLGPNCYCGKQGCLETYLSGPGLALDYHKTTGKTATSSEIVAAVKTGNSDAEQVLNRYLDRLARGLATIINVLDPSVIVLGGGLSNIDCLYTKVPEIWGQYVFSDQVATLLKPALHGDSSGVRGAAWLWPQNTNK